MLRTALIAASFAASAAFATPTASAPTVMAFTPTEGAHFRALLLPVTTSAPAGKVEVIEFYSLGCPHCAEFEPYVQSWLKRKPANVDFKRVPATFNPMFALMARVHFALDDVKGLEKVSAALFEEIHTTDRTELRRPLGEWQNLAQREDPGAKAAEQAVYAAIGKFVARYGVDEKKFLAALKSPSMNIRLSRAETQFRSYGVLGVPAFGVNGKYFTTVGRPLQVRNFQELLATVDFLVKLESKSAATAKPAATAR